MSLAAGAPHYSVGDDGAGVRYRVGSPCNGAGVRPFAPRSVGVDLRPLPRQQAWMPGDPVVEIPQREKPSHLVAVPGRPVNVCRGRATPFFQLGTTDTDTDGDGQTNFLDLGLMKASFFLPPGPSGIPNLRGL